MKNLRVKIPGILFASLFLALPALAGEARNMGSANDVAVANTLIQHKQLIWIPQLQTWAIDPNLAREISASAAKNSASDFENLDLDAVESNLEIRPPVTIPC